MKKNGFTFIEILIGIALLMIIMAGLYGAFQLGFKVIAQSRARITATALANQQIEMARNLSYADLGTKEAVLPLAEGILDSATTTLRNDIEYTIETQVKYIVDEADGLAQPEDDCPNDYKRAQVKVSWPGLFGGEVVLVTDAAPKNLAQECAQTGGILSVAVFDAAGAMVTSPLIEIFDLIGTKIDSFSPVEGQHYFPLAAANYQVVVSKDGYSGERTYGTDEVANPAKPHPPVLNGQLTEISFSIDQLSSFAIETLSSLTEPPSSIGYVSFYLQGNKIIGTDADEQPVPKYSADLTTDSAGQLTIPNLEWDIYDFTIEPAENLDLASTTPASEPPGQWIELLPDTIQPVSLFLEAANSCLVQVRDSLTLEPIFSAQVRLYQSGLGYDQTQFTDEQGQTLFIPLEPGIYNLEVQVEGYGGYSGTISVSGDSVITIDLTPTEPS